MSLVSFRPFVKYLKKKFLLEFQIAEINQSFKKQKLDSILLNSTEKVI